MSRQHRSTSSTALGITAALLFLSGFITPRPSSLFTSFANLQAPLYSEIAVGVLDLDSRNVADDTALLISDRLRFLVSNHPAFLLIERDKIHQIIEEQGFQISGACNTNECVAQVGNIIGVRKMIAGSIGQAGTRFTIQIRIFDIETSVVEFQEYRNANSIEDLLDIATESVLTDLADQVVSKYNLLEQSPEISILSTTTGHPVAVMDLLPLNDKASDEAISVSDRLRIYVDRIPELHLITKETIEAKYQELGLSIDLDDPDTDLYLESAIQAASSLGAKKLILGTIAKIGTVYTIQIREVDVTSGRVDEDHFYDARGIGDLLTDAIKEVAVDIADRLGPPPF